MATTIQSVITQAQKESSSVASLLRTALDLGYLLNNSPLIDWCKLELNGYFEQEQVPTYRQTIAINKGYFIGLALQGVRDIPTGILPEEQRYLYENMVFRQSLGSLQKMLRGESKVVSAPWNPNDVARASQNIYERMTMTQAWQEVSAMVIENIIEVVQNKIYFLALDLRQEYPEVEESDDSLKSIPSHAATGLVVQHIYGYNSVINANASFNSHQVVEGDLQSLSSFLRTIKLDHTKIQSLLDALEADSSDEKPHWGQRVTAWIGTLAGDASSGALVGVAVEALKRYFGLNG